MTVKELKEFLKDIPDDVKIRLVQDVPEDPIFKYEEHPSKRVVIS